MSTLLRLLRDHAGVWDVAADAFQFSLGRDRGSRSQETEPHEQPRHQGAPGNAWARDGHVFTPCERHPAAPQDRRQTLNPRRHSSGADLQSQA
jgi:hypothetical protein